jgi:hypothetical protein
VRGKSLTQLATLREDYERRKSIQHKRIYWIASRFGSVVRTICFWGLVVLLISSVLVASTLAPRLVTKFSIRIIIQLLLVFGALFAVFNGLHGVTIKRLNAATGAWAEVKALSVLSRLLMLEDVTLGREPPLIKVMGNQTLEVTEAASFDDLKYA